MCGLVYIGRVRDVCRLIYTGRVRDVFVEVQKEENEKMKQQTQNSSSSSLSSSSSNCSFLSSILSSYLNSQSSSLLWRKQANKQLKLYSNITSTELEERNHNNNNNYNYNYNNNKEEEEVHNTSLISSIFVLIKSTIGTSIYVLPYSFSKTGWFFGIIFLCFGCFINIFSLHLLALCSKRVHPSSFYAITKVTFPHAVAIIDLAIALDCLGTSIAFLVVIGGIMPQVMIQFDVTGILLERQLWITIAFLFCIPCGFVHRISAFKWTSALADLSVAFFCIILILYSSPSSNLNPCDETNVCTGTTSNFAFSLDTLKVFSIYSMAFNCQMQLFPVVNELKYPTTYREDLTISTALLSTFVLYLIVAVCGYSVYGNEVSDNALESYPNNLATNLARVLVSLQLVLSYPLILLPGRESMVSFWSTIWDIIEDRYKDYHIKHFDNDIKKVIDFHNQHYCQNIQKLKNQENENKENQENDINQDFSTNNQKSYNTQFQGIESDEVNELNDNIEADNILLLDGVTSDNQIQIQQDLEDNQNDIEMILQSNTSNPLNSSTISSNEKENSNNNNNNNKLNQIQQPYDNIKSEEEQKIKNQKNRRFNIATVLFLGFTYCIAISPVSLGLVSEIIGATGAVLTTFLLPGAIYIVMFRKETPKSMGISSLSYSLHMIGAYLLLITGLIITPVCLLALFF